MTGPEVMVGSSSGIRPETEDIRAKVKAVVTEMLEEVKKENFDVVVWETGPVNDMIGRPVGYQVTVRVEDKLKTFIVDDPIDVDHAIKEFADKYNYYVTEDFRNYLTTKTLVYKLRGGDVPEVTE